MLKISRRGFLITLLLSPIVLWAWATRIERHWLKINRIALRKDGIRIAHISDLHYLGDRKYIEKIIAKIHAADCKYVFFTGDLIDSSNDGYLDEALELITQIKLPVYGVAGNHDPVDPDSTDKYRAAFKQTGGAYISHETIELEELTLWGQVNDRAVAAADPERKKILLNHYPAVVDTTWSSTPSKYDLVLAGHSHGGQVRLPFVGPIILPGGVGRYDRGLIDSPMGPLYVNVGIGTFAMPIRFMCRPELAILEV